MYRFSERVAPLGSKNMERKLCPKGIDVQKVLATFCNLGMRLEFRLIANHNTKDGWNIHIPHI